MVAKFQLKVKVYAELNRNSLPIADVILPNAGTMTLTLDKFGRVLIPKPLRQHLMLQPGDKINVVVNNEQKSLVLSAKKADEEAKIVFTDWGFPVLHAPGKFPDDFDPATAIKDSYEAYFKQKFGF